MGTDLVLAALGGAENTSPSYQVPKGSKFEKIQPLMSIFSGEMVARANKVNQEVSDKIAKIKAMQEEILRPRESKSKSSARSGRQMSDHDYNQMTKELGYTIQLRQVHASDAGSVSDDLSYDQGCDKSIPSNPATIEYFGPGSARRQVRNKLQVHHSQKVSLDLVEQDVSLSRLNGEKDFDQKNRNELISPSLYKSVDTSPMDHLQIATPASVDLISPDLTDFPAKLFKPRFSKNSSVGSESAKIESDKELKRLKMQNGLLIVSNRLSHNATVAKQVFLVRWRNKVQRQRKVITKMVQLLKKQGQYAAQASSKQALHAWKTFKDAMLNEEIQSELDAISRAQRGILVSIQKSFTDKRNMRIKTRFFNAYLKVYNQIKSRTQACIRLERVLRRQIRKRQKNSWKALRQQPFVSDLADEEIFSLYSGATSLNNRLLRQSAASPMGYQARSVSAQNQLSPLREVSSQLMDMPQPNTLGEGRTNEEIKVSKIKGGVKIVTISVKKQLTQGKSPTIRELFALWKTRARFERSSSHGRSNTDATNFLNQGNRVAYKANLTTRATTLVMVQDDGFTAGVQAPKQQLTMNPKDKKCGNFENYHQAEKQTSSRSKPSRKLDDINERPSINDNTFNILTPEHEVRADINTMLNEPQPSQSDMRSNHRGCQEDGQAEEDESEHVNQEHEHRSYESLVTTSDISSVDLDSDDSCFAATVEVIKLDPVKNARDMMPSTTNVSQIDQHDQKMMSSLSRKELKSISDDQCDQPIMMAEMDENNDEDDDDENNVSRSPPIDAFSQGINGPKDSFSSKRNQIKNSRIQTKSQTSKFANVGGRKSIQTPRRVAGEDAIRALTARPGISTSPAVNGKTTQRTPLLSPSYQIKQEQQKAKRQQQQTQPTYFTYKSNSMQTSSKKVSVSSDPSRGKEEVDTPQFKRSEISIRQKSQASIKEDPYYEMTESLPAIKQFKAKQKLVTQTEAEIQKQTLMLQLAKVAEAQIRAVAALQEEKLKEKNRSLAKERDRKTNMLFQKKNLRGVSTAPQVFPKTSPNQQASQILATMKPESARKTRNDVSRSLKRNKSEKTSFISASQIKPQELPAWAYYPNRSQMATPRKQRIVSGGPSKPRGNSTTQATPMKDRLAKINIDACLTNILKVKMPYGTINQSMPLLPNAAATARFSDLPSTSKNLYGRMSSNPFIKMAHKCKTKRNGSNLRRATSKSSLKTISDRPLKTSYVPPVYKSRAFRNIRQNSKSKNSDISGKDNLSSLSYGASNMMMTTPQLQVEEQQKMMGIQDSTSFKKILNTQQDAICDGEFQTTPIDIRYVAQPHQMDQYDMFLEDDQQQDYQNNGWYQTAGDQQNQPEVQNQKNTLMSDQSFKKAKRVHDDDPDRPPQNKESDSSNDEKDRNEVVSPVGTHYRTSQIDDFGQEEEEAKFYSNGRRMEDVIPADFNSSKQPNSEHRQYQNTPDWIPGSDGKSTFSLNGKPPHVFNSVDAEKLKLSKDALKWNSERNMYNQAQHLNEMQSRGKAADSEYSHGVRQLSEEVGSSSQGATNFTLAAIRPSLTDTMPDHSRRMTFGREKPDLPNVAQSRQLRFDNKRLSKVSSGLQRLERAVHPRIERYKVELFIHLCTMLEEDSEEQAESEEEDVYGKGQYLAPKQVTSQDYSFKQYYQNQD